MKILIIGNGISGITAARFIRKHSDHEITVVSAESDYFFSRTALMYVYMGHMRFEDIKPYDDRFWPKNRIQLLRAAVRSVHPNEHNVLIDNGENISYDRLIIASGSVPNRFGWPGQDLDGVHGLYSLQDLDNMERHSKGLQHAVIVGGGLIGVEMAEMFHSRHIPVTFLIRESSFWNKFLPAEESAMVNAHLTEHGIRLRLSTELREIQGDENGKVKCVITSQGEQIDCGYVGLTTGVQPNISFLHGSGIETDKGVLVDERLQTSLPDIYAIGDCAQLRAPAPGRRDIEAVWYTGRMMGETVAHTICGKPHSYQPGIWFNSAKFFDIEYQVYGEVPAGLSEQLDSVYWEHPNGRKSIRIVYERQSGRVKGFNLMGIRYRQEVCEYWIQNGIRLQEVLQTLSIANFDPELSKEYEACLIAQYEKQSGNQIGQRRKRGLNEVLAYFRLKNGSEL